MLLASTRQGLIHLKIAFKKGGRARATGALAAFHRLQDLLAGGRRTQTKYLRASDLLFLASEWCVLW